MSEEPKGINLADEVDRLAAVAKEDDLSEEQTVMAQTVELIEVEKLKFENISLKRTLLQQQMDNIQTDLNELADSIKSRVGAPSAAALRFDPQTPNIVQIETPPDGDDGS